MAPVTIPAGQGGAGARAAAGGVLPGRDELLDAVALSALTMIGFVGFRTAYGGHGYLAVGAAGVLLGLLLSHAGQRARLPLLAVVAASVLAFLLSGGVISQTGTVSLPTLQEIAGAAISGWQQLLTTARPVGRTAGLLVLPYLLGLFSGVAGHALARRTTAVALPAAAPAVVVALSILFGAPQPTAAVLQGAGFAAAALAWMAVRQSRGTGRQATIGRQRPWQRIGAGALVLAAAGAGATFVGPHLPGAGAHRRVVLAVVPPFDVTAYPSPLAGYRDYTKDAPPTVSVWNTKLLSTTGLPARSLVRIAAMDSYDGLAWGVANAAASSSTFGGFQRVGTVLPGATSGGALPGAMKTADITIEPGYRQPWLPDLAGTAGFTFPAAGPGAGSQAALRFNVATTTGIIPAGVSVGMRYTVSYASAPVLANSQLASATPDGSPDPGIQVPPAVQDFAQRYSQAATTPMGKVIALANYLRDHGRYSNGGGSQSEVTAGHSAGRLTTFLESRQIVGDDEQYAATMALLANWAGVPARVSLDGIVRADGTVYGRDVHADVELRTAQYGWVTLPYSRFTGTKNPTLQVQKITPPAQPVKVVPPRRNQAAPVAAANSSSAVARSTAAPQGAGFAIPAIVVAIATYAGIPVFAVAGLGAALAAAKVLRRRRRRDLGPPAARVAGAWRELVDLGRDLGITSAPLAAEAGGRAGSAGSAKSAEPAGPAAVAGAVALAGASATRREQAALAELRGLPRASVVAAAADAAIFGPADPDDGAAAQVWALVEDVRRAAIGPLSRRRRLWVAVNPASLWASRGTLDRVAGRLRRSPLAPATSRIPRVSRGPRGSNGPRDARGPVVT